ncbi:MAG: UDP-N-acetylmuramate--L-alanine ligase [Lachnospiraceae bacterium]|nr:UDP-N-acetylmuramate--L-alanine ligase [Lachnospiraceae bacterium]
METKTVDNIDFDHPIHIYFIGIGGISMSGLAGILLSKGFKISGSDSKESDLTKNLEAQGANVFYGQEESHIPDDADLIVYTAAIRENNPEYIHMKSCGIPYLSRAEFLGLLMKNYKVPVAVAGTHGKTTTTTMLSEIFLKADLDPTITVGGVVKSVGSNIRNGAMDYFVFEACEYTNSFLSFFPKVSVILNVEEDHLDFFKDIDDIRNSFNRFAKLLPADGLLVINGEIEGIEKVTKDVACPIVTYGSDDRFDYWPSDITFDDKACPSYICHVKKTGESFTVKLDVTGVHNVMNSLAAIAVSDAVKVPREALLSALSECSGSKRRFEYRGSFNGVTVIDDYAHHPTEIKATLKASMNYPHKKLWCVFQPHTYTRTKAFLHEFAEVLSLADHVVLADVYPAREKDIYGCNSSNLYEELKKLGTDCTYLHSFEEIEEFLHKNCINGDLLITMGAGDVVKIADRLTS